jgi:hypothetical protein
MIRRQPTKTVALDLQRAIESRAHVLEGDGRRQIDDLLGVEVALELVEYFVGNVDRAERHLLRVAERGALGGSEQRIFLILSQRGEFLFADSDFAATGSVDVDSEKAADHLRRAHTDHPLQRGRRDPGPLD